MRRFILLLCMATATLAAQGQVLKCTHPKTGAVTFSDVPCETGQNGVVVQQRKSDQEIWEDNQRAAEANDRKYRQRMAEQGRQYQSAMQERPMQRQSQPDKSRSHACQMAKRDHETVSSSITGTAEQRRNRINASASGVNAACGLNTEMIQPPARVVAAPTREIHHAPPTPTVRSPQNTEFTHCNGGFCYGNQGGTYHRNGPNHMTGPNGESCTGSGTHWICN